MGGLFDLHFVDSSDNKLTVGMRSKSSCISLLGRELLRAPNMEVPGSRFQVGCFAVRLLESTGTSSCAPAQ